MLSSFLARPPLYRFMCRISSITILTDLLVKPHMQQIAVAKALVNVRTQLTLRKDGGDSDDADAIVCVEPVLAPKLAFIEVRFWR